ncbi:MAG: MarR family transcriptional regulator [Treponema sp.]|jgi:DNA-binding transcriptional regulator LsrR (DeoR family)|nr:MarR family transcriptional regulator [Treponema sp.]
MVDNYYEKLLRTAVLYYSEELTQQEVAQRMGVSRQAVNKYLAEAKEKGIIEFKINNPIETNKKLEKYLRDKYKLKAAVIASGHYYNEDVLRYLIAQKAVDVLKPLLIKECRRVALSWGRTVYALINQFPDKEIYSDSEILPLFGTSDNTAPYFMINELVRVFAEKIHGTPRFIYLPVSPADREDYNHYIKTRAYTNAMDYWKNIDLAVIGIGDMTKNSSNRSPYPGEDLIWEELGGCHIVGDICAKYFDKGGRFFSCEHGDMLLSIPLEDLKNVKMVVAMAGGNSKVKSIKGALLTNIIDVLITDEQTASYLAAS